MPRSFLPVAERRGDVEQVGEGLRPDDTDLLEERVVHPVGTGQRAGVRHRRLGARLGATDLERHDRLAVARRLQRRGAKLGRIAHRLDVERDDLGRVVVGEVVDEIRQLEVDLVARRDELRQSDPARRGTRQERAEDAAALRDDADPAHGKVIHLERTGRRQHDAVGEVHQADRVRAEDAHRAGGLDELLLAARAVLAGFGVAAGQHDRRGGTAGGQVAHRQVRAFRAEQDDAHVRGSGQRCHVLVAGEIADAIHLRVDRIDRPRRSRA